MVWNLSGGSNNRAWLNFMLLQNPMSLTICIFAFSCLFVLWFVYRAIKRQHITAYLLQLSQDLQCFVAALSE